MQLLWGREGTRAVRLRESERSKLHECMQIFFTNFISISIH